MIPLLAGVAVAGVTVVGGYFATNARGRRHRSLRKKPFPPKWIEFLEKNVGHYPILPPALKTELHGNVQIFLAEKKFEGCGGLVVNDEMRVTVAGLAGLLLLNRPTQHYPDLTAILLYPTGYLVNHASSDGVSVGEEQQGRLGESWVHGTVVLSWNDVTKSAHNIEDGHNLALHEFAHQLDQEDGVGDGVPPLERESHYTTWANVLSKEYQALVKRTRKGKRSVMDSYGATNPAEFFAVATETFFEKPHHLKKRHPELYEELQGYYRLDPVTWTEGQSHPHNNADFPSWVLKAPPKN